MPTTRAIRSKHLLAGFAILFAAAATPAATLGTVTADGYVFTNFDLPNSGNAAGSGTNINGIANNGAAVGFSIDDNGNFSNFVRNSNGTVTPLNLAGTTAMALGINSSGDVVGQQNGAAFFQPTGGSPQMLRTPADATNAFGINDQGAIVGQFSQADATPGFYVAGSAAKNFIQLNAPSGPNIVNAQGVNDVGLVAGFYVGNDGQFHGFEGNIHNANKGVLSLSAIADPTIPNVAGEPGATFVFSQMLGVNDNGIAVGYYGDSTASEHGFLYNSTTGAYTFVDDPAEQFFNGVEVTQITGINNSGELAGFYSDSTGVFHGFVACPVGESCSGLASASEPASRVFVSLGLALLGFGCFRRPQRARSHEPAAN